MDYIIDQDGKKEVKGNFKLLYEGNESEQYLSKKGQEEQARLEEELLESLRPSDKEVLMAEVELETINLLLELEVI